MIHGVVPPIPTPLTADEDIDVEATHRLVALNLDAGVDAIWVHGTTGRFDIVTTREQVRFARLVAELVAGRVPLVLNVSEMGTRRVLEKAALFGDLPYDAYAVLCPWYQPLSRSHLTDFYNRLADELNKPLLIYNAPWVCNMLSFDHLRELAEHPRIIGAKDVTNEYTRPLAWTRAERQALGFSYLIGAPMVAASAQMGADGSVTALSTVFPELCVAIWKAVKNGDHETATRGERQFMHLSAALGLGHFMSCLQVMFHHRGLGDRIVGHPISPLDDTTAARVIDIVRESGVLG
jgi:dihydrodipicolinate synthase/N-acetylneuraminate lyase